MNCMKDELRTVVEEFKRISDKHNVPIITAIQSDNLQGFKPGNLVAVGAMHTLEKKIRPGIMEPQFMPIHVRKLKECDNSTD